MLSESLISLDRIALMERIGLLARVGSTKIRTVRECALSERYASPTQIVIPASCPPRNSPFDKGSRNRRGRPPLRSSLDPRPSAVGAKSLSRSLGGYDSPACVQLTPKVLFHLAFSWSDRYDRPSASCRLSGVRMPDFQFTQEARRIASTPSVPIRKGEYEYLPGASNRNEKTPSLFL